MSWNTKYEIAKRKNLTNQETVSKKYKTMKTVQMKNGNGMLWSADLRYMTPCCDMRFPWNGAMLRSADFPWNDALLWSADFGEMTLFGHLPWNARPFDLAISREMREPVIWPSPLKCATLWFSHLPWNATCCDSADLPWNAPFCDSADLPWNAHAVTADLPWNAPFCLALKHIFGDIRLVSRAKI